MSGTRHQIVVALGDTRYRVDRPFGTWPQTAGKVSDVVVLRDGRVLVLLRSDPYVDPDGPRVIVLSCDGDYLGAWGDLDIADAHLMTPAPDGRLFIVDRDMHEIIVFSADGQRVGGIGTRGAPGTPFNHPTDVAFAPSGDFYVSDGYAGWHVHRFAGDGTHLATWGAFGSGRGEFLEPHSLWCLPDGRVVVVDRCNNRLQVFDADGVFLDEWTGFHRAVGIWGDDAGDIFVSDQVPSLHRISQNGTRLGRARPVLNGAHGIFGSPDGTIYLAEANPSRVSRLTPL
ncbi:peptidase [Roseobacter denitrificans]|uniref:Peptidylglycine alpha-amidating monooxygenase, putative n=1 Tax=Roseobacter denitrificans (strain ATCC 33942 / OCh 114) TaxID=375451 RepID=Q166U4_ROSDO|nr:peptidase [Roseobacter denitrificans]ABG31999.1 peptidylglycine alpha-amidating monooxygenase, putative [Roseobacter denitrificans OCh 114]AVL51530.1 peptidase [Roseobacter denitrificans]SFG36037.1 peptidylglycine monooxygenase [Roseobacter denitrificans OCh 114]